MIRILACLALIIIALMTPLWLFALAALCYAYRFGPYEVLVIALLIDIRFGDGVPGFAYVYTVLTLVIAAAIHVIRPRLQL